MDASYTGSGRADGLRVKEIRGLTNGQNYRVRVRARYAGGVTGWAFGSGTPKRRAEPLKLTPNSDLLTGLTINDGVRDLPIAPAAGGPVIGLGGPEYRYYVHVPPGVRSVTVTPTWTNTSIASVSGVPIYLQSQPGLYWIIRHPNWASSESGTGKSVSLMSPGRPGQRHDPAPARSQPGLSGLPTYRIYLQHNNVWKSANDRLNALALEIGD